MEENKDIQPNELSQNISEVEQSEGQAPGGKVIPQEENILPEAKAAASEIINPTQTEDMEVHHITALVFLKKY